MFSNIEVGDIGAAGSGAWARINHMCWQISALSTAGQKLHSNSSKNVRAKTSLLSTRWTLAIMSTYFCLICGPRWVDHGSGTETNSQAHETAESGKFHLIHDICNKLAPSLAENKNLL